MGPLIPKEILRQLTLQGQTSKHRENSIEKTKPYHEPISMVGIPPTTKEGAMGPKSGSSAKPKLQRDVENSDYNPMSTCKPETTLLKDHVERNVVDIEMPPREDKEKTSFIKNSETWTGVEGG